MKHAAESHMSIQDAGRFAAILHEVVANLGQQMPFHAVEGLMQLEVMFLQALKDAGIQAVIADRGPSEPLVQFEAATSEAKEA